jgi:hypothetical protein
MRDEWGTCGRLRSGCRIKQGGQDGDPGPEEVLTTRRTMQAPSSEANLRKEPHRQHKPMDEIGPCLLPHIALYKRERN